MKASSLVLNRFLLNRLLGSEGNAILDFAFLFTLSHPVSSTLSVLV